MPEPMKSYWSLLFSALHLSSNSRIYPLYGFSFTANSVIESPKKITLIFFEGAKAQERNKIVVMNRSFFIIVN